MLLRRKKRGSTSGQAMTETVIIMPIMVFLVFGAFQLMLLQHARILVDYAGYNACRAGIVNNGDKSAMVSAALGSVLPLYGDTSDFGHLLLTWGKLKLMVSAGEMADNAIKGMSDAVQGATGVNFSNWVVSNALVDVRVISPRDEHFVLEGEDVEELDFDDVLDYTHYQKNLLAAETRVMVPLKVPIFNKILWQLYMARAAFGEDTDYTTSFTDQVALKTSVNGEDIKDKVTAGAGTELLKQLKLREALEYEQLLAFSAAGVYFIPIRATCGMQMQSNFYKDNNNTGALDADFFKD